MFVRLLKQKQAINLSSNDLNIYHELTSNDWELIQNLINLHNIFDQATFAISKSSVTTSETIPIVNSIIAQLKVPVQRGSGIQGV